MNFSLKKDFLLGVSSAATQIEGGELDSNWNKLWQEGGIKDSSSPAVADEHWKYWKEDDDLLISLGIKISRIGIEWSRIEPREGEIDYSALDHYRRELEYLKENGVEPLLTIHHFSNPMWFENKGGWLKSDNNIFFLNLVNIILENLGDLVSDYITINEPNVYATNSYCFGVWYPRHNSLSETLIVLENMSYCHIMAYNLIHNYRSSKGYKNTKVGIANHVRPFEPLNSNNPLHIAEAKVAEWLFQGAVSYAMMLGKFYFPLYNHWNIKPGEYSDFIGINYYSRSIIDGLKDGVKSNSPKNDLGWEIYPDGLLNVSKYLLKILYRPIWITENGTADNKDLFRSKFIYEHLKLISESVLPFKRYYHWCFIDNWEWAEGETARFGIVYNDFKSQKREIKKSGLFYSEIIKNNGVTEQMFEKFVKEEEYNIY